MGGFFSDISDVEIDYVARLFKSFLASYRLYLLFAKFVRDLKVN